MQAKIERLPARRKERVAVLLNANANAVSEGLRRELENFVPPEDLFWSRSFDDARTIARTVLERGYDTVLTGGGDGTFVAYVNCLFDEAAQWRHAMTVRSGAAVQLAPRSARLPKFGVLKLGTGNAVAEFCGSSPKRIGVVEDILRTRSGEVPAARELHLLTCEGKRAPFAGLGIDAAVLNDYARVRKGLDDTRLRVSGGMAYFLSVVARTIPSYLLRRSIPNVEVVNLGGPVQQIGPDGKQIGRNILRGEVIYRGPCRIAAAGTVPCYGFGFRMFPFALKAPGRFQLRLSAISLSKALAHLPRIWRGQTPRTGMLDFHCDKLQIAFDREMPLQIGGDAEGYRKRIVLDMSEQPLELLDFSRAG